MSETGCYSNGDCRRWPLVLEKSTFFYDNPQNNILACHYSITVRFALTLYSLPPHALLKLKILQKYCRDQGSTLDPARGAARTSSWIWGCIAAAEKQGSRQKKRE